MDTVSRRFERKYGVNKLPLALRVVPCLFSLLFPLASGCECGGAAQGKVMGVCGLEGILVECVEDNDCGIGTICSEHGECSREGFCEENGDCQGGFLCTADKRCRPDCGELEDCPEGFLCNGIHCFHERCGKEGMCPEGWEIVEGSLSCKPELECPAGTFPGRCGMAGRCIQCLTDEDCSGEGEICLEDGRCEAIEPCGPDNRCSPLEWCAEDGICRPGCSNIIQCDPGSICKDHLYCIQERCSRDGSCPKGWEPVTGSLACRPIDCESIGFIDGACGLEGFCVQCNHNGDCDQNVGLGCSGDGQCMLDVDYECSYDSDCVHYLAFCRNYKCVFPCELDIDCWYGSKCGFFGECERHECGPSGTCPDGWKPVPFSLACIYDPCSDQGLVLGGCGLSGRCVGCFVDQHCPEGICSLSGDCVIPACSSDADCGTGEHCVSGRCGPECSTDADCTSSQICTGTPATCRTVRCNEQGWCSVWGWQPVAGTLACTYDPCSKSDLIPGVCGKAYWCVECIDDSDCGENRFCTLYGGCLDFPDCGPGPGMACSNFEVCVDGKCLLACKTDEDCIWGAGDCLQEGYCRIERCARDGSCPNGWVPGSDWSTPGAMACVKIR